MKKKIILIVALALMVLCAVLPIAVFAADTDPTLTVNTAAITTGEIDTSSAETCQTKVVDANTVFSVGDTFYVPVILSNMASFDSVGLQMTYNSEILEFTGIATSFSYTIPEYGITTDLAKTMIFGKDATVNPDEAKVIVYSSSAIENAENTYGYLFFAGFKVIGKSVTGKTEIGIQSAGEYQGITMTGVTYDSINYVAGEINVEQDIVPLSLVNNSTESWNSASYSELQSIMASGEGLTPPANSGYYFMGWFTGLQTDEALTVDANGYYVLSADLAGTNYVLSGATELRPCYDSAPQSGEYHALWLHKDFQKPYSAILQTTDTGIALVSYMSEDDTNLPKESATLLANAIAAAKGTGRVKLLMDMNLPENLSVEQLRLDMNGNKISVGTLQVGHGVTSFVDSSYGKGTMDALLKFFSSGVDTTSMVDYIRDVVFMDTLDFYGASSFSGANIVRGFTVTIIERCTFNNPDGLAMNLFKTTVKEIADCEINAREFIYVELTDVGSVSASNTSIHDCEMTQTAVGAKPPFAYNNQYDTQLVFGSNNKITALHGYTVTAADGTTSVSHNLIAVHEHNQGNSTGTKLFIVDEAVRAEVNADTTHAKSFYRVAPGGTVVNTAGLTLYPTGYAPETDAAGYLSFADVYTVTYKDTKTTTIDTQFARDGEGYKPPQVADIQDITNSLVFYKVIGWSTEYVNKIDQTPENPAPETIKVTVDGTVNRLVEGNITLYPVYEKYTAEPNFKTYFTYNEVDYTVGSWSLDDVSADVMAATGVTRQVWSNTLKIEYKIVLLHDFKDTGTNGLEIGNYHDVTLDLMGHTFTTAHGSASTGLLNVSNAGSGSITITSTGGRGKIVTEGYVVLLKTAKNVENSLTVENVDIERTGTGSLAVFNLNPGSNICTTNVRLKNVKVNAPTADFLLLVVGSGLTDKKNATVHVTIENCEFSIREKLLFAAKDATGTTVRTLAEGSFLTMDAATKIKTSTGDAPTRPLEVPITCTDANLTELHDNDKDGWYSFHICSYDSDKHQCTCGKVEEFTISWDTDGDGDVDDTTTVEYGTIPTPPANPTKESTAEYSYTFKAWSPELVAVTGDATYTATYTETKRSYTITFVDENGTELQSSEVAYGETPVYTGATPTKAATAQYTYTFKGWSPVIEAVTGNATYTAQYDTTTNTYTITWIVNGETTTETYEYGATPEYKGATPTKAADADKHYTFKSWGTIVSVTGDATYTATFEEADHTYSYVQIEGSAHHKQVCSGCEHENAPEACTDVGNDGNHACDSCGRLGLSACTPNEDAWGGDDTYHWRNCTDCNQPCESTIKAHSFAWRSDEDHHWEKCTGCTAERQKGEHTDADNDGDHVCDLQGCTYTGAVTTCGDSGYDHVCDNDSACDVYNKGGNAHADSDDLNHTCDYCNGAVEGEKCVDTDDDHKCDECGEQLVFTITFKDYFGATTTETFERGETIVFPEYTLTETTCFKLTFKCWKLQGDDGLTDIENGVTATADATYVAIYDVESTKFPPMMSVEYGAKEAGIVMYVNLFVYADKDGQIQPIVVIENLDAKEEDDRVRIISAVHTMDSSKQTVYIYKIGLTAEDISDTNSVIKVQLGSYTKEIKNVVLGYANALGDAGILQDQSNSDIPSAVIDAQKTLINDIIAYGNNVQIYFNSDTSSFPKDHVETFPIVKAEQMAAYKALVETADPEFSVSSDAVDTDFIGGVVSFEAELGLYFVYNVNLKAENATIVKQGIIISDGELLDTVKQNYFTDSTEAIFVEAETNETTADADFMSGIDGVTINDIEDKYATIYVEYKVGDETYFVYGNSMIYGIRRYVQKQIYQYSPTEQGGKGDTVSSQTDNANATMRYVHLLTSILQANDSAAALEAAKDASQPPKAEEPAA